MEKVLFADVFTKNFKKILHVPAVIIDDPIFRLHYKVTGFALLFLSIIVTGYQFIGEPIKCIQKDDIPENLLNTYCWIEGTFSLPKALIKKVGEHVVYPGVDKYEKGDEVVEHSYYQWVCFVLFLQAVMFCIPYVLWKSLEGGKLRSLVQEFSNPIVCAEDDRKIVEVPICCSDEGKERVVVDIEDGENEEDIDENEEDKDENDEDIDESEEDEDETDEEETTVKETKKIIKSKKRDYYKALAAYYEDYASVNTRWYALVFLACEFLNFVNVLGQMFFLDRFLGGYFTGYGSEVVRYVNRDQEIRFDPMIRLFPRLTKCTFHRYGSSGDVQKHDALCLLPLNILNEKIFVIMWFWLLLLAILGGCVLIYRVILVSCPKIRFKLLHYVTSLTKEKYIEIFRNWPYEDWFQLYMLAYNIDNIHFKRFIKKFHKSLRKKPTNYDDVKLDEDEKTIKCS